MNSRGKLRKIRIIAGQWRGRHVHVLNRKDLRPTIDRVRETLFNWLMFEMPNARVLDLYAGTGILGLEALSRGAIHADFVELNPEAARGIESTIQRFEAQSRATVYRESAQSFLLSRCQIIQSSNPTPAMLATPMEAYTHIFIDPPFASDELADALVRVEDLSCLAPDALIYLEQDRSKKEADIPANWRILRSKQAGQSRFSLLRRHPR